MDMLMALRAVMSHIEHAYASIFGLYTEEQAAFIAAAPPSTSPPPTSPPPPPRPEPTAATIGDDDEGEEPLPVSPPSMYPKCTKCGGPNLSLSDPICIACRIAFPRPTH